jgi:hypothetical protein
MLDCPLLATLILTLPSPFVPFTIPCTHRSHWPLPRHCQCSQCGSREGLVCLWALRPLPLRGHCMLCLAGGMSSCHCRFAGH